MIHSSHVLNLRGITGTPDLQPAGHPASSLPRSTLSSQAARSESLRHLLRTLTVDSDVSWEFMGITYSMVKQRPRSSPVKTRIIYISRGFLKVDLKLIHSNGNPKHSSGSLPTGFVPGLDLNLGGPLPGW